MRAFRDCEVGKRQLLASLRAHQAADRIIQGHYWNEHGGCAWGCSVHDFRPGDEGYTHFIAPELFGVPEWFAAAVDSIHEMLPPEVAVEWPVRVWSAVPVGADVDSLEDDKKWPNWLAEVTCEDGSLTRFWDAGEKADELVAALRELRS